MNKTEAQIVKEFAASHPDFEKNRAFIANIFEEKLYGEHNKDFETKLHRCYELAIEANTAYDIEKAEISAIRGLRKPFTPA